MNVEESTLWVHCDFTEQAFDSSGTLSLRQKKIVSTPRRGYNDAPLIGFVRGFRSMPIGPTELIIILVIVLLLFGVGRVSRIGGELGSAVANFRKGLEEGNKKNPGEANQEPPQDKS
jgi:sec-independent protein translocase protein TatA